ncbi:outer membrane beta-barrel protein [Hymenobacter bucti]|uniref:Outer membrane beta-barrel protein n=1 Tax=Hymenobacter bucti TaxID=1844114 RepID=A0ABW4QXT4_9BACT
MIISRLILGGFLLGSPLLGLAQDNPAAAAPKFYAGLAIYSGSYHSLGRLRVPASVSTHSTSTYQLPVQATLGYQWRPRLAVQLGLVYSGRRNDYTSAYEYTDANSNMIRFNSTGRSTLRHYTASLQARYTLTRKPEHRFQVDVAGGVAYDHQYYRGVSNEEYTNVSQGTATVTNHDDTLPYNEAFVSVGPSLRYRFGQRLEVVYDLLLNQPLSRQSNSGSMALGLRYRFGPS